MLIEHLHSSNTDMRKRGRNLRKAVRGRDRKAARPMAYMPPAQRVQFVPVAKSLGRMPQENKYVDGYYDKTAIHALSSTADDDWSDTEANPRQATAVYGCMPVPRQGTNYADRDGRKIIAKALRIKGVINWQTVPNSAGSITHGPVRLILVKDTRTNGATLSGENVIGPGLGSDGLATLSGDSGAIGLPTDPDGWGRYEILFDKMFRPPPISMGYDSGNSGMDAAGVTVPFKISIKKPCEINFSSSTGAVGSIVDNSYHLLAATTGNITNVNLSYYARLTFVG